MQEIDRAEMRPECAKEFGKIEASLDYQKELKEEQSKALDRIEKEIEKLFGNGNKGKIDEISICLNALSNSIIAHIAKSDEWKSRLIVVESELDKHRSNFLHIEGAITRLELLEKQYGELEKRFYSTAIKVSAAIGTGAFLLQFVIDHFILSK